ncbi:MAG: RraA family protein [Burkholderiales bacterium]|nr:RraA family protein [Burkholderiales bacterium]MBX3715370.1 RraA family protein [Burkholderiales bacterium]
MPIGFRILPSPKRTDPKLLERLRALPVSNVSDNLQRGFGTNLEPMHRSGRMAGTAFTVRTRPGDNLMVHKAIEMAEPGDVIVVDAGGALENAIIGELMAGWAEKRGVAGFVIDGAIRDSEALAEGDFPVYAAGVTHRGPWKDGPGEINVTVAVGGMVVNPGDLVAGDHDGVVAIPQADAEQVIAAAEAQHRKEAAAMQAIKAGTWDRRWVDEALRARGCEMP